MSQLFTGHRSVPEFKHNVHTFHTTCMKCCSGLSPNRPRPENQFVVSVLSVIAAAPAACVCTISLRVPCNFHSQTDGRCAGAQSSRRLRDCFKLTTTEIRRQL
ncbi:UNVERIFIED_CONTAM: hypothetical protein FKN15_054204 [Acipenser sinensis]